MIGDALPHLMPILGTTLAMQPSAGWVMLTECRTACYSSPHHRTVAGNMPTCCLEMPVLQAANVHEAERSLVKRFIILAACRQAVSRLVKSVEGCKHHDATPRVKTTRSYAGEGETNEKQQWTAPCHRMLGMQQAGKPAGWVGACT